MSELHCPARFLICSDPSSPEATAALARERVALRVDDAASGADELAGLLDELADRYRGECVVITVAPATLSGLDQTLLRSDVDRDITVVS